MIVNALLVSMSRAPEEWEQAIRQAERESMRKAVYNMYMFVYIYIYIYICVEREMYSV